MALMNEVRLIGHCADAPTSIPTQSGKMMAKVSIYTAHWWRDESGIQKIQKEIHRCLFFGSNADRALKFLQKGTQIHLSGTLHKTLYADINVQEFTVADRIMVSKEMYEKIFPGEKSHRAELPKQRYEMENFDEDLAKSNENRIQRMRGVKNAKKHF